MLIRGYNTMNRRSISFPSQSVDLVMLECLEGSFATGVRGKEDGVFVYEKMSFQLRTENFRAIIS